MVAACSAEAATCSLKASPVIRVTVWTDSTTVACIVSTDFFAEVLNAAT